MTNKKANIFIVDDEPVMLIPLLQYFIMKGYNVIASNSLKAAMSVANADWIDVIITDFKMNTYTAVDIIRNLKNHQFKGKIILISGHPGFEKADMKALNVDAFFEKPFELAEIYKKIQEWTQQFRN